MLNHLRQLYSQLNVKLKLQFRDTFEEQEYLHTRRPIVSELSAYFFLSFIICLITYTVRWFIKNINPQEYLICVLVGLGFLCFFTRKKIAKYLEYIVVFYVLFMLILLTTVINDIMDSTPGSTLLYMGYAYAFLHRLVGYGIISCKVHFLLYMVMIPVKYSLLQVYAADMIVIVVCLEVFTILLAYKSDVNERTLFDAVYKAKKDVLKFKHLLTQYLPNQMAIFAQDFSTSYYFNNAFKRTFKCPDLSKAKEALAQYVLDKDALEKNERIFTNLGILEKMKKGTDSEISTLTLSEFMSALAENIDLLRDVGMISFPVIEGVTKTPEAAPNTQGNTKVDNLPEIPLKAKRSDNFFVNRVKKNTADGQQSERDRMNTFAVADENESMVSSDKASSKTSNSDFILEEGQKRVLKVKIFPLMWDNVEAIALVFDDITQQKIIMELKVADKNKDLVIATVSHELRTPINGMLGMLEIAKKNITDAGTLTYLNACRNSGVLMLNLVNSILDLSQIRDKKLKLIYSQVNVRDLMKEVNSLFDYNSAIKNLYFNLEVAPDVPRSIVTDKNRLCQILVNLLANAFKFTFQGGITVRVKSERKKPCQLRFEVTDTGIGIKKDDQDRLFKMYGKLDQHDKKMNTQGVGLGLTISNTLAGLLNPSQNKTIQMESEVGKGTTFSFVVQSVDEEAAEKHNMESGSLVNISSGTLSELPDISLMKKMSLYPPSQDKITKITPFSSDGEGRPLINSTTDKQTLFSPKGLKAFASDSFKDLEESTKQKMITSTIKNKASSTSIGTIDSKNALKSSRRIFNFDIQEVAEGEEAIEENRPWCLVVDDNPFNLMVACHIMQERNYLVKTALNGQDAVDVAVAHQKEGKIFNVILMDCQMPVMNGYEATRELKKLMKNGEMTDCAIIALTANNRDEEHEKLCKEAGMSGQVAKPLQIEELEKILRDIKK